VENVPPENREISFVYQDYVLFPHLNAYKNISFGLHLKKVETEKIKKNVMNMAEMLGIEHLLKRYPGTLSGGEQQRVALARALVMKPDILLLDEPFSALDPNTKKSFWQELKKIHTDSGCTVVHVTHDFEEASFLADRIGLILNGKLKQVGKPDNIFNKPKDEEIAKFLDIKTTGSVETPFTGAESA
jgi:ABC-type sugar transport system ATPase subunit